MSSDISLLETFQSPNFLDKSLHFYLDKICQMLQNPNSHLKTTRSQLNMLTVYASPHSISNIGRIRKYLDCDNCERLVHVFISWNLDSCNSLLTGLPDKEISRLQRTLNATARLIVGATKNEHMSPILQQLHWLPVKFRIDFKILMLTYKALDNQAPDCISELLTLYKPSRALRSSCQMLLVVPKTKTKLYGDRSFAASAPRLWNILPVDIKNSESLNIFKSKVKTRLFCQCYRV